MALQLILQCELGTGLVVEFDNILFRDRERFSVGREGMVSDRLVEEMMDLRCCHLEFVCMVGDRRSSLLSSKCVLPELRRRRLVGCAGKVRDVFRSGTAEGMTQLDNTNKADAAQLILPTPRLLMRPCVKHCHCEISTNADLYHISLFAVTW